MWLLLLDLQHEHQAGVLVAEEVEQEDQEVVDDVGLVALPARVHVDSQARVSERQPLDKRGNDSGFFFKSYLVTQARLLQLMRVATAT